MKCAAHPEIETNLSCGKCGTPICPKCLVQTPVGMRCRKCAGLKRLPTYEIGRLQYLKAVGVGLGVAVGIGILWAWLWGYVSFFNFLLAAGVGYTIGEALSMTVNRKRGRLLVAIAAVCVVVSYLVANVGLSAGVLTFFAGFTLYDILVLGIAVFVASARLH